MLIVVAFLMERRVCFRRDDVISASEIGQYHFCPMSWYLQRCGYKPRSDFLSAGKDKHVELGKIMYYTQENIKKSRVLTFAGYCLLVVAVLLFLIFEVVL